MSDIKLSTVLLDTTCEICGEVIKYFPGKRPPKYHKGRCEMIYKEHKGAKAKKAYKRRMEKRRAK